MCCGVVIAGARDLRSSNGLTDSQGEHMADYELEGYRWGGPGTVVRWSFATTNYSGQHYSFDAAITGQFQTEIRLAFDRWEQVAQIDFVEVSDSASVPLRMGFDFIDGQGNTLGEAWNTFNPSTGISISSEIRFETNEGYTLDNGRVETQNGGSFYAIALHEIGHSFGLGHYTGGPAIMNPIIYLTELTASDVHGIQAIYGLKGPIQVFGTEPAYGTSSADNIQGDGANNQIYALAGDDVVNSGMGADIVYGGAGNDTILGDAGTDTLYGDMGNDAIAGGTEADAILGGEGDDIVFGGAGNDAILGQNGADVLWGEDNAGATPGNDGIDGGAGNDTILGQGGNDTLVGGPGGDAIAGGDGVDILYGDQDADILFGEAGGDLIYGGAGGDVIRGGAGSDLFVFNVGDNGDLIQNFNEGGERDGFDLRGYFNATGFAGSDPRGAGIMQVLQGGADTDVYLNGSFAFRIEGVVAAAIDDTYFLFQ